jgi:hypothetical protein
MSQSFCSGDATSRQRDDALRTITAVDASTSSGEVSYEPRAQFARFTGKRSGHAR